MTSRSANQRPARLPAGTDRQIAVHVDTHAMGTLLFASGAMVQALLSFDVQKHSHPPVELYGERGTLQLPEPIWFGGDLKFCPAGGDWESMAPTFAYADANYRSLGLADMAFAILNSRPHRASGDLALHVLEVMEAFDTASRSGRTVDITTTITRPTPLSESIRNGALVA